MTWHLDCQKEKGKIFRLFLDRRKKFIERREIFCSFMLVLWRQWLNAKIRRIFSEISFENKSQPDFDFAFV